MEPLNQEQNSNQSVEQNPLTPQFQQPEKTNKFGTHFIFLSTLLIISLIGAGLVFAINSVSEEIEKQEVVVFDQYTDWKTYRNNFFGGLEFKYPSTWIAEEGTNLDFIVRVKNQDQTSLRDMDQPTDMFLVGPGNDIEGQSCDGPSENIGRYDVVDSGWDTDDGLIYWRTLCTVSHPKFHIIMSATNDSSKEIENKILSTLKHTDKSINISDWKISEMSDSFIYSYPPDWSVLVIDGHGRGSLYISPYDYHDERDQPMIELTHIISSCEEDNTSCVYDGDTLMNDRLSWMEENNKVFSYIDNELGISELKTSAVVFEDIHGSIRYYFVLGDKFFSISFLNPELFEDGFIEYFLFNVSI